MTRRRKTLTLTGLIVVAVGAAVGWMAWREFVVSPSFDADFYAVGDTVKTTPYASEPLAAALRKHVKADGMVDYSGLKSDRADLDRYVRAVAFLDRATFGKWPEKEQIAFLLNAYNALTLKAIVDRYPIESGVLRGVAFPRNSIRQIPGVWDKLQFLVLGDKGTLDDIEHKMLRAKHNEPRVHMALVCAAMGCPPLRNEPYTGQRLDEQLGDQSRTFLANTGKFGIDKDAGVVHLSKIFSWFGKDFVKTHKPDKGFGDHGDEVRSVLAFAAKYLGQADADYLREGKLKVKYLDYDWSLNDQAAAGKSE